MPVAAQSLDQLAINSIRFLAVDAIEKAKSGHPGLPMGAAPMAYVLWQRGRMRPTNTTGLVGVYRSVDIRKKGRQITRVFTWIGYWVDANGKRRSRRFSVNKYGVHP